MMSNTSKQSPPSLVWISGNPGCGKTTAGDYLEAHHGYKHIDVDNDFVLCNFNDGKPDPNCAFITQLQGYMKSWKVFFGGDKPLEEDFGPMVDMILEKAIEMLEACENEGIPKRVVITQGWHREGRDYVCRKVAGNAQFAEHGVKQMFYVGLAASLQKKIARWRVKQNDQVPATMGKTHAQAFQERTGMELTDENFEADYRETMAKWIPFMSKYDIDEDEMQKELGANIWLDEGDEKVFPSLRKTLGLPRGANESDDPAKIHNVLVDSAKKLALHFTAPLSR
jgi:hypothetical protein